MSGSVNPFERFDEKTEIYYRQQGNKKSGISIVFIPGAGANLETFEPLANDLNRHKCFLLSLPGHHRRSSTCLNSIADYSNIVELFINEKKERIGENIIVVGHSMGGMITIDLALKKMPQIKGIVLLNTSPKVSLSKEILQKIYSNTPDLIYLLRYAGISLKTLGLLIREFPSMLNYSIMMNDFRVAVSFNKREELKEINIPVLIFAAKNDGITKVIDSKYMKKQIKKSELFILNDCGHLAPQEAYKEIASTVNNYIAKIFIEPKEERVVC